MFYVTLVLLVLTGIMFIEIITAPIARHSSHGMPVYRRPRASGEISFSEEGQLSHTEKP